MSDRWPVHTVVFDLDDTLYLEREFVLSGVAAVDRWLREERQVEGFAEEAGQLFDAGLRGQIFDGALTALGQEASPPTIQRLVEIYRAHEPALTLAPDAAAALAWAAPRFRLALITDGYAAVQVRKIRALALERHIPLRIVTDEIGRDFWKPHPEAFRRVMTQCPGPAAGYLYIGDNPRKDFLAPHALGWRTLRIRRPGGEHCTATAAQNEDAEREVETLAGLEALLESGPAPVGMPASDAA